jgi:ferritin-like metal-binding protein YciE
VFAQLAELLWIERTLAFDALPALIKQVRDGELRHALAAHLDETSVHVGRVEAAFRAGGGEPAAARSAQLDGLLRQHREQTVKEETLRDLACCWGGIRTEHLELAVYDTLLDLLQDDGLRQNRDEEKGALERLARIGERLRAELRA